MLCFNKKPKQNDLFQVPFGPILTWEDITNFYPNILNEMNGEREENYLLFYYEFNPVTSVYKAIDEDTENDLADIFGLDLHNISTGETKDDELDRNRLESLSNFMNYNLSKEELDKIKNAGMTVDEYLKLSNEDSINSNLSFESDIEENGKRKVKNSAKKAKKERRKLLVESRKNEKIL